MTPEPHAASASGQAPFPHPADSRGLSSRLYITLFLAVLILAVYLRAGACGFITGDDMGYVMENPHIQQGLTPSSMRWALTANVEANWHPLTLLSLQLDSEVHGLSPFGYHLTNVLLHTANTLLLFWTLCSMTGALWRSAAVAALFALHPLHVESVAWVSERKDVLSTFFWILTLAAYVHYVRAPQIGRYLLVLLSFALGLTAKPMLVTLPCVLLLLDYWPLLRWRRGQDHSLRAGFWPLLREKLPLFALSAAASVVTVYFQRQAGAVRSFAQFSLEDRLANALLSYVAYMGQTIWPAGLAFFYPHHHHTLTEWPVLGAGVLLASLTAFAIWQARRCPYFIVGWLWYLGTLVPVIGIIQVGTQSRADRYTYVPQIGLFLAGVWGLAHATRSWRFQRPVLAVAAGGVLAALTAVTWVQIGYWRDSITLFKRTLQVTTGHYEAHAILALQLERDARFNEARWHYEQALALHPDKAEGHTQMGAFLQRFSLLDEALRQYHLALQIDPSHTVALNNVGVILLRKGKLNEARSYLADAVRLHPDYAEGHYNLASVLLQQGKADDAAEHFRTCLRLTPERAAAHYQLGTVLEHQQKLEEALSHLQTAARLGLDNVELHFHLGQVLRKQGRSQEAIAEYRQSANLEPQNALYQCYLGYAHYTVGQTGIAQDHYQKASLINPRWIAATQAIAWEWATHQASRPPGGPSSVELAQQTCQATHFQDPVMLDTLAAAYADAGRFDDAVKTARKASEVARSAGQTKLSERIDERLVLYTSGKPFRVK
jgi:tetratricopeptide (TPR) repeat protein